MGNFFEVGLLIKPLEVGALLVVTERAGLRCRINQARGNGFIAIFHGALLDELLAGPVAGLADHAVFGFNLLRRDRLGEIVRGRMALQTLAASLRIINAEFLGGILGRLRPEHFKRLRVWTGLPLGELIATLFLLVTNAARLHADIVRRITLRRPRRNGQKQHNTRTQKEKGFHGITLQCKACARQHKPHASPPKNKLLERLTTAAQLRVAGSRRVFAQ